MTALGHAYVLDAPGLYVVTSSGPTSYYVDTRDPEAPLYMRWRGQGMSLASPMDNTWHDLIRLTAAPASAPDLAEEWLLHRGMFHTFFTTREASHLNSPLYWVSSRVCEQIRRLEAMPNPLECEKADQWLPPGRMVALAALAVPVREGWGAFVPDFPGLNVVVQDLDHVGSSLVAKAASLTGRDCYDFIVSIQYTPPLAEGDPP